VLHVGLTGGLASGKSFVGRTLAELGCYVIRADDLGHQALEPGGEAYQSVIELFGKEIREGGPGTSIDRRALGARVFADPAQLEQLNALVHPVVRGRARALARAYFQQHPDGIAVFEAAILIETGSYKDYDRLIVAVCRREQQIERALARGGARYGLTREEVLDRMSRQIPLQEKVQYADYVIDTSGSKEETAAQTRIVFESLKRLNHES
jgi:dephospho-CoA kinase